MLNAWTSYPVGWLGCVWTGSWGDSELPSWGTAAFPAWLCRGNRSGTNRAAWATEPNVRIVYPERRSMIICCAGSSVSSLQCCLSVFLQTTAKGSRRKQRRLTFPLRRRSHTFSHIRSFTSTFQALLSESSSSRPAPRLCAEIKADGIGAQRLDKVSYLRIIVIVSFRSLPWNGSVPVSISNWEKEQ